MSDPNKIDQEKEAVNAQILEADKKMMDLLLKEHPQVYYLIIEDKHKQISYYGPFSSYTKAQDYLPRPYDFRKWEVGVRWPDVRDIYHLDKPRYSSN